MKTLFFFSFVIFGFYSYAQDDSIEYDQIDSSGYEQNFQLYATIDYGPGSFQSSSHSDKLVVYSSRYQFPKHTNFFLLNLSTPADFIPRLSLYYQGTYRKSLIYYADISPFRYLGEEVSFSPDIEVNLGVNLLHWTKEGKRKIGKLVSDEPFLRHDFPAKTTTHYSFGIRSGYRVDRYSGYPEMNSSLLQSLPSNVSLLGVRDQYYSIGIQFVSTYGLNGYFVNLDAKESRYKQHRYFLDVELPLTGNYIFDRPSLIPSGLNTEVGAEERLPFGVRIGWEEIIASKYRRVDGEYRAHGWLYQFGVGAHLMPRVLGFSDEVPVDFFNGVSPLLYLKIGIGFKS